MIITMCATFLRNALFYEFTIFEEISMTKWHH